MQEGKPDYRGMRALLLTRVSTPGQEEMYGHTWQESQVRKLLIEPLGLKLDEERHIIRDTYSGLEYRYREALERILDMAERGEFDVLCMEVLDRGLGRKALQREMYRMQLREFGVRILTTDPNDFADDDSITGQINRFHKGIKAEEEIIDFVRRSKGGKVAKAAGDARRGIPPRVIGYSHRLYGYKYILNEKGKRIGVELNYDVIHVEPDGTEWTEVKVVRFIFESAASGMPIRQIAEYLNKKGVPTAYQTMGIKNKRMKESQVWQPSAVGLKLKQSDYWGEHREFKTRSVGRAPGKSHYKRVKTTEHEQVIIPVPAIVTKELALLAQEKAAQNKKDAGRNNYNPQDTLLRAGYAKCGYCGVNLTVHRDRRRKSLALYYTCANHNNNLHRCDGCNIPKSMLDPAAWEEAMMIIRDPGEVDAQVYALLKEAEVQKKRKHPTAELAKIRSRQSKLRNNLSTMMQEGKLDKGTREFFNTELQSLAEQEETCLKTLASEQAMQEKYNQVEQKLRAFHKRCDEWREKLDDLEFTPSYEFKRDAIVFFGITAIAYREGHKPRFLIERRVPSIVSILASMLY